MGMPDNDLRQSGVPIQVRIHIDELRARITELEQELTRTKEIASFQFEEQKKKLADKAFYAKESADGFDREVKRADALQHKLTERDKLLDECLEIFVSHGYGSYPIAAKLQERER